MNKIKIKSDGTNIGTEILDSEGNKLNEQLCVQKIVLDCNESHVVAHLDIVGPEAEINAVVFDTEYVKEKTEELMEIIGGMSKLIRKKDMDTMSNLSVIDMMNNKVKEMIDLWNGATLKIKVE